jgi:crotonobetainyl-CoA:carnitine CoA-transferase CaiB-like acyl-CoA transferase
VHEGQGRTLDLSLYETALSLVPYQLVDVLAGGAPAGRHGTAFPLIVPYQVFETADGELMIVAANDRLYEKTCQALGVPELAADDRFATNPLRIANREQLIPLLQERIATEPTADLLARLREAGVPASPVNDLAGVAQDEQLRATGILQELGGRELVSPPFSADGERVRYGSEPPLLGQHSRELLSEAGYSETEIDELAAAGVVALRRAK